MSNPKKTIRKLRRAVIVLSVLLLFTLLPRCGHLTPDGPQDQEPMLEETWSYGYGETKVVRIPLEGVITRQPDSGLFAPRVDMVQNILMQIQAAENDPDVLAILLEVSSPGGGVTPSDEIYHALTRFRHSQPDRRILVFIRDMGASGAYYAAMASDWIIAEPTAAIGSIGVIMQTINMQSLSEKIGITDVTIKSGANKDILNPFKAVDPNQIDLLQQMINEMQTRFTGLVAKGRGINPAEQPDLFDGRIFSANLAHQHGLIDEVGYWEDAVQRTATLLNIDDVYMIRYEPHKTAFESLMTGKSTLSLPELKPQGPQFLYQWKP